MPTNDLTDFYEGTTKAFSVTITYNGSNPDITGDTVSLIIKTLKDDTDANAILTKNADVTTEGASGIANFTLTASDTAITPGTYHYEIQWVTSDSREYTLILGDIIILERVYDVS